MAGATEARTPPAELLESLARLCPEVGREEARAFLSHLDADYWEREKPEDVAAHLRLAASLSPERPARVRVSPREGGRFDVAVVAFDYFGEFATALRTPGGPRSRHRRPGTSTPSRRGTGVRPRPRGELVPAAASRRIVDIFRVPRGALPPTRPLSSGSSSRSPRLVGEGRAAEAREQLTVRLVETLERMGAPPPPSPWTSRSTTCPRLPGRSWTCAGRDAPGFLYAFANALATRGLYVHRVQIESRGSEVHDRFAVTDREGRKIEGAADQQALRLAVVLIHQFTLFLASAPDPVRALRSFDQLLDRILAGGASDEALALFRSPEGLRQLARLLGSSAFLWEDFLRAQFEQLRPLLEEWSSRPIPDRADLRRALRARLEGAADTDEERRRLNEYKDEEMLLIDMKHLLDPRSRSRISRARSPTSRTSWSRRRSPRPGPPRGGARPFRAPRTGRSAAWRSSASASTAGGRWATPRTSSSSPPTAGRGRTEKSGLETGRFYEALVHELVRLIEARQDGIFHVDLRLRPHGGKGALASPLCRPARLLPPGRRRRPLRAPGPDQAPPRDGRGVPGTRGGAAPRRVRLERRALGPRGRAAPP